MAKEKIFTERFEIRMTKEHRKILKEIARDLKTTENEAIRVCICDYWDKI